MLTPLLHGRHPFLGPRTSRAVSAELPHRFTRRRGRPTFRSDSELRVLCVSVVNIFFLCVLLPLRALPFSFVMFGQGIRQFGWPIVRNQTNPNNYDEKISKTARIEHSFAWRHGPDFGHVVCLEQWRKWHRDTKRPLACPGRQRTADPRR